jgi:CBS domain containing-hemolysin-like protein
MILGQLVFVFVLVLANGFFVATEFALVKVRLSQIEVLAQEGSFSARIASNVLKQLDAYLSACQLGITLASLGLGWVGEPMVAQLLYPVFKIAGLPADKVHYVGVPLAFATITFLHVTLGEQAPKILAIQKPRPTTLASAIPLVVFYQIFRPLIWILNSSSNLMLRVIGLKPVSDREQAHTEEELRMILAESAAGGSLTLGERLIMENVLNLEDKRAKQVMVPRSDIVFLNTQRSLEENFRTVVESGHTRFPLCDGNLDHVVGMVHAKTLLQRMISKKPLSTVRELAQDVPFFPENIGLDTLLKHFLLGRRHMAVMVDEYGVIAGLVTFEDVLEQLVGPIYDEFDREQPPLRELQHGRFLVDAMCPLPVIEEKCHFDFTDIEADTAGGLVSELLGHIAKEGESVRLGRFELRVTAADAKRVRQLEIIPISQLDQQ